MIIIPAIVENETARPEWELTDEEKVNLVYTRYINEQYEYYMKGDQLPI